MVVLALPPFTVKELENRVISGGALNESGHNLEKCLAQSGRAVLGDVPVLRFKGAGLVGWGIYTSKGH